MRTFVIAMTAALALSTAVPAAWARDDLRRPVPQPGSNMPASATTATTTVNPEFTPGTEHVHHFEIRSSVQVSREALKEAYEASREAYTKKLEKFAKCTAADAQKAVSAAHPGMKVETVQLRNIRTSLVYVAIAEDEEDRYLVIVDAGNCRILLDRPIPTHHERVFAD